MNIALIYARSENRCIGTNGRLPWHLPDESAFFEATTHGKPVIMGRRTYEDHRSLLPARLNIVVTRSAGSFADGIRCADSLQSALQLAAGHDEAFVVGGVRLFAEAMPRAERVYETVVHARIDGDTWLPTFDFSRWQSTLLCRHPRDKAHAWAYSTWLRRRAPSASANAGQ